MFKNLKKWAKRNNGETQELAKLLVGFFLVAILIAVFFHTTKANADCTGCGDDGHAVCPVADDVAKPEVVFAVCVFADGTLIDHKGANSMSDCLKTKREVEKLWRNKAADVDSVEINGITYKIDGESLAFMCDLVDANVHHYEDGTWEIVKILGKQKK